jgi:carbonic anhydrase/acetyltransferase-like protein (isoleucine patch superfamily)
MRISHGGRSPTIDDSAWIAPTAVISGDVRIGAGTCVMHGAVLTAQHGASVSLGAECVVMEQAVLRGAGRFDLEVGDHCLVGPHAYLAGCTIESRSFIATGAMVFNGAVVGEAAVVALDGKVHIDTELPPRTRVPAGWLAVGRPAQLFPPDRAPEAHDEVDRIQFMRYVFGVEVEGRDRGDVMDDAMARYTSALTKHAGDEILG